MWDMEEGGIGEMIGEEERSTGVTDNPGAPDSLTVVSFTDSVIGSEEKRALNGESGEEASH